MQDFAANLACQRGRGILRPLGNATLAQSVEQALRKRPVSSSSLEGGSDYVAILRKITSQRGEISLWEAAYLTKICYNRDADVASAPPANGDRRRRIVRNGRARGGGKEYDGLAASAGTQDTQAPGDGHLSQVWAGQLGWQPLLHHLRHQIASTGIRSPNRRGDNEQRDKERLF